MKNCNMTMFFEMRKKLDLYMWLSMVPNGPSARYGTTCCVVLIGGMDYF